MEELAGGEPSLPGGLVPLPLGAIVPPSGSVTLTVGDSVCAPLERGPGAESDGAVPRERLLPGVESLVSMGSGGVFDSVSLSLSLPLFLCFFDCCWPMGRACEEDDGEPG